MRAQNATAPADLDTRSRKAIELRLAYGFTVAELCAVCELIMHTPALVDRKRIRSIARVLHSDREVCEFLGREYHRPDSWLTPFEKLWQARHPAGQLDFGVLAKNLDALVDTHGTAAVEREFAAYIDVIDVQYVSWPRFRMGYGGWHGKIKPGRGRDGMNLGNALEGLFQE